MGRRSEVALKKDKYDEMCQRLIELIVVIWTVIGISGSPQLVYDDYSKWKKY